MGQFPSQIRQQCLILRLSRQEHRELCRLNTKAVDEDVAAEKGFMPVSFVRVGAISMIAITALGCATSQHVASEPNSYLESTADVANRAPTALSVPQDAATGMVIDPLQMRARADYHFTLAESYALEGNTPRAIEEYKTTLIYDPKSAVVRLRLAQEYIRQSLISESLEQARLAIEADPEMVDAHLLLGGIYSALRMYDEAMQAYRQVILINPENTDAPTFIGALYAEQKRYAEALAQFEALAKNKNNRNPHVSWFYVGRLHLEENKPGAQARAEKAFMNALEAKPEFIEAILSLAQVYETTSKRKLAKELYTSFQEKFGPDGTVADALAKMHLEDEEYDQAFRQLEIIVERDPDNLNAKMKIAYILIQQKKFIPAISKLEEILSVAPNSDKILFYLGAVYEELKDYRKAIAQFEKIPLGSSYYTEAVVHTAYLHKILGRHDQAIETIEVGIKSSPDQPQFYALLASILDEQKEYERGVEMLESAVRKFPEHAQLHFFLGSMQDRLGATDKTITSMRRVLEIDSNHVQALNFLAYTYAEQSRNLEEAEKMARRALTLQPNDGYILDTLGWVLFKRGQIPEAIKALEAAHRAQPKESIIAEHLGDAYYKQQLHDKAKQMYKRAAETETNSENLLKLQNKIVSIERQYESVGAQSPGSRVPASETSADSAR